MRYLVTGAAGFIGSHLTESLRSDGHDVVGLDSFTDYYDPALKEENARGLDVQRVDLAEDRLDFAGFDAVFHLAGQPGARSFGDVFPLYLRRNVLATQRVFEAAVAAGVKVVWASSSSVYGDAERYPTPEDVAPRPNNPYGITKLACEQLHETYSRVFGLQAVALRFFTVYGPRQRPDMAFARIVAALGADERRSSCTATARSHVRSPMSPTSWTPPCVRWRRHPGSTTWGAAKRRRCSMLSACSSRWRAARCA